MGKKNVSMKTIATECGVSINTVSHALRDFSDISKNTKQMIRQKAIELGYLPNIPSQRLKIGGGEKAVVAVLVSELTNLYFSILCDKLIKIVEQNNEYDIQILFESDDAMSTIKQCILQRVDMVITHRVFPQEAMEYAKINNIKVITIGCDMMNIDADVVTVNEAMSCEQVARYLWGIHKANKFLFVGLDYYLSDLRYGYFKNALNSLGVTDIMYFNESTDDIRKLLDYITNGYRSIFFYDDVMAYRILNKLDDIVVDVRKVFPDLHLVGFDGLCENILGLKQISTVLIDYSEFAKAIYDLIRYRFDNPTSDHRRIVLSTSIHQRTKS